jgi:hypothetical protein
MDILDIVGFTAIFLGLNTSFGPDDVTPSIKGWHILKPNDGECCAIVIRGLGFCGFTLGFLFRACLDVRPIKARDFSTHFGSSIQLNLLTYITCATKALYVTPHTGPVESGSEP